TASKEWVIQPKPKPGRKPKKDQTSPLKDNIEVDPKGRRIQNRAAQRAFRERKQSQLSELQARIQAYEQGEIERNVALQNVAKRLKEENEKLRQENISLRAKLAQFHQEEDHDHTQTADKKRWRDDSPASSLSMQASATKRTRIGPGPDPDPELLHVPALSPSHLSSPTSYVSSPNAIDTADSQFSELSYNPQSTFSHFGDLSSSSKAVVDHLRSFPSYGCGFCNQGTICVCHEIAVQDIGDRPLGSNDFKPHQFGEVQLLDTAPGGVNIQKPENASTSILDNLPAYQPPVRLRRRPGVASVNSVFPVARLFPHKSSVVADPSRSGDPSNCLACGDDDFGKAFCEAIASASSSGEVCNDCPSAMGATPSRCCGSASSCKCPSSPSLDPSALNAPSNFMPTNDAWRKIKAHPNVEFTDLSLLAEVVASRSICSGSLSVSATTEMRESSAKSIYPPGRIFTNQRKPKSSSPPPRLVPQDVLLECGRRTLRRVHADGVREALRFLDAKFTS
ncbi:hypothetical protein M413DRAFT_61529, partial [Hebeloma cylindrosporum]